MAAALQTGEMVYLKSVAANVHIYGVVSDGETPDQFCATLEIAGDQATMSLAALVGPPGPAGENAFALRLQRSAIDDPEDLPQNLTDDPEDLGKYWVMNQYDTQDEVQQVTITGSPHGGTFTLTYGGQTTAPLPWNVSAASVRTALEALSTIGNGNVTVTGDAGGPWIVTFVGALGAANAGAITVNGAGLSNPSPSVVIETTVAGIAAVNGEQTVTVTGSPTGGNFTLTFGGQTTANIAYNASASTVQTRLEALSTIGAGNVTVTGGNGGPYTVTFVDDLGEQTIATMTANGAGLTGGTTPGVTVAVVHAGNIGVDERQTVTVLDAGAGTFTLTYSGQTTDPLPYNAAAGVVEAALDELSNIDGDVTVSGVPGSYLVVFTGDLGGTDVAQMTANTSGLTGIALAASAVTLYNGGTILTGSRAYIWFGDHYRVLMMGSEGPPGPVPEMSWSVDLLDPDGTVDSWVEQTGTVFNPSLKLHLRVPRGPQGLSATIASAPDVDMTPPPTIGQVLGFNGRYLADGTPIWEPMSVGTVLPRPYIMPEASFTNYQGLSTRAPIGAYGIPPQEFPWKPIVWGKIRAVGIEIDPDPLIIGCEVRLGDPNSGQVIARGFGNITGWTNLTPHTSTPSTPGVAMTPENETALVDANHTGNAGTIFVNLYNDGLAGLYLFNKTNAQIFVMVVPV